MSGRLLRRSAGIIGLIVLALVAYLCFWPIPAEPVAWVAPTPPGFTGPYAANTKLSGLQNIDLGSDFGPEHIAIGPDGKLYAAMDGGALLRMDPDGANRAVFANTGGRVLGFDFDAQGRMIAADAMKGLLLITPDAQISVLVDRFGADDRVHYANSIVVAPGGTIYFTDASGRFSPSDWGGTYEASVLDIMEQAATGRVLAFDPATGRTRIVAHGFSFANGLALASDEQSLFVSETGRYRIWKVDARADNLDVRTGPPEAKVLIDNLPGYPDNLMRGREGRIWIGLFKPRNPAADSLAQKPFIRKVMLRLPRSMIPLGESYGHVVAFDEEGRVTADLQDPSGTYPETTGVTETAERLYIHSLHAKTLGWLPAGSVAAESVANSPEEIHILRSIREPREPVDGWCASSRTGFEPMPTDAERFFSFWSVRTSESDGRVVDAKVRRVAELRACMGATRERPRQNFYAEIKLGSLSFQGKGECLALALDFPEAGMFPVRCQLILSGLPPPYVGGVLTTNTMTSRAGLGGESDPPGYTQASIATIRLWKQPVATAPPERK